MKIQLLYFDGCPSWERALKNLKAALQEDGLVASIELTKVGSDEEAGRMKFPGSPSFRVDGRDLWADQREGYSLSCRVYPTPGGLKGYPTVEMLKMRSGNTGRCDMSTQTGFIPAFITEADFGSVTETEHFVSLFGPISMWRAVKGA